MVSVIMMNLPREVRFRKEWTMVLGVIPGPTEPKKPIVDDLLLLCNEVPIGPNGNIVKISSITRSIIRYSSSTKSVTVFGTHGYSFKAVQEHDTTGASGKMSYLTLKMAPIRMRDDVLA